MKHFIRFVGYILIGILITVIGFIIYFNTSTTEKLDPISFVPNDAAILIESENITETLSNINQKDYKKIIQSFPLINNALNTLNNDEQYSWIKSILENKKATFSVHPSLSANEDFLLIIDIDNYSKINFIPQVASHFNKTLKYRKINSLNVYSIKLNENEDQTIHFVILHNLLVCSSSYKTLENSIHSLYNKQKEEPELTMPKNSFGRKNLNIYVHEDGFKKLPHLKQIYQYTEGLAYSALSQVPNNKHITFEGYTSYYDSIPSTFQTLKHLQRGNTKNNSLIPSNIKSCVNLNIKDFNDLYSHYMSQLSEYDPIKYAVYMGGMKLTQSYLNIDIKKDIFNWMTGEISLASLNKTSNIPDNNILFIVRAKDINLATKKLENLARKVNTGNAANYRPIIYKNYKINFLNISGFFKLLLNNYLNTREKPYYTKVNNYVIFSNSENAIKRTIDAIIDDKTLKNDNDFKSLTEVNNKQYYISALYKINTPIKSDTADKFVYLEIQPEADLLKTKIQFFYKE